MYLIHGSPVLQVINLGTRGCKLVNESARDLNTSGDKQTWLYAMHTDVITAAEPVVVNSFAFRRMKESACCGENYAGEKNTTFVY